MTVIPARQLAAWEIYQWNGARSDQAQCQRPPE
jgi:hypothetical protein